MIDFFKRCLKNRRLKELPVPIGHLIYSRIYGLPRYCTCEACSCSWDLDNSYIKLSQLLEFLDNHDQWDIKYKGKKPK